jgi:hypothetical protein
MIEINIDNTGDNVEDLSKQLKKEIRCIFRPYAPGTTEHQVQLKPTKTTLLSWYTNSCSWFQRMLGTAASSCM